MVESLANRIAYLRGLAEGMDISEKSAEGKIVLELIDIIDDVAAEFRELHDRVEEAEDYVEALDEDLEDVELYLFDDEEQLYETVGDCSEEDEDDYAAYYDLDDDEDAYIYENTGDNHLETTYEFSCPSCQEVILLHEGTDEEGYTHYVIEPSKSDEVHQAINPT
ncbi:CD1247 N-terminal domain-containing protein [Brevibacillus sp. NRS-1366]|uniref:CD1247 N-terminal domain-containing protein n=1 Tax=Brevibacillus sp. NRS-1366 TaxID=3233899 RepID=UPI003D253553